MSTWRRVIVVTCCGECPYYQDSQCARHGRYTLPEATPDWCPLSRGASGRTSGYRDLLLPDDVRGPDGEGSGVW